MNNMKFTRTTTVTPVNNAADEVNLDSVVEEKPTKSFKFGKKTQTTEEVTKKVETENKVVEKKAEEKTVQTQPQAQHKSDWDNCAKILPKLVNKSSKATFGSAVEFSKAPFALGKRDKNGYRDSLDGKLLMNFWTFDVNTNKQLNLIPTYIDISEWLNVCHMITSGRLHEMTADALAKQKAGGYKFCSYIYQNNGGSYKNIFKLNGDPFGGNEKSPIATVFKITPSNKENSWVLSSEIYDGITGETGLIEIKQGTKPHAKIQVLLTYDDLVRIARMSEMAIMAFMVRM